MANPETPDAGKLAAILTAIVGVLGYLREVWLKKVDSASAKNTKAIDRLTESEKLAIERTKADSDADDRLIKTLLDEREKSAQRYEARIASLETTIEKLRERDTTMVQTRAEHEMQILMLTREKAAVDAENSNLKARLEQSKESHE